MDAILEFEILRAEAVGGNAVGHRRHGDEQRIGFHPPGQPLFELRLAAEFVDEVAVVVERGAIADDVRRARGGFDLRCDLRVQDPELAFERGRFIHRQRRAARDFGDEFDVVIALFQEGANFVGQRRFADAVRADKSELQD